MIRKRSEMCMEPNKREQCGVPMNYVGPENQTPKIDPTYDLKNPAYIDPLYRPYYTDYSKSPLIHPYAINTKYPLIDPYRRRLGLGMTFRSQHEGICPAGYRSAGRNLCIPLEPESWGTFYTNDNVPRTFEYSNCMTPYNADKCDPCRWKKTNKDQLCDTIDNSDGKLTSHVYGMNGYDNKERVRQANCVTQNFW